MESISTIIIRQRRKIIVLFAVAAIVCMMTSMLVKVNYSLSDYLPKDSKSTIALELMQEQYEQDVPNARAMVSDVSLLEARSIKEQIKEVEGVKEVTWLDDSLNIYEPIEMMDEDILESYYKDNKALFTITINEEEQASQNAVNEIRQIIGEDNHLSGSIVNAVVARQTTEKEITTIMMIAVPTIFLILLLTTTSWFEPVLFLGAIGVAVLLNCGTNIVLGEVSFVTNSAGSILQLAVSMDYSIFLLHQFETQRKTEYNVEKAMQQAWQRSFSSIMSSGLTTVVGFLALLFMRFKIGPDMGIVMAKAVVLSLASVFLLLPCIVLETYPLIDKTKHRFLFPSFEWLGKIVYKTRFVIVALFVLCLIPCYLAQGKNTFLYGESGVFLDTSTKVGADSEAIDEQFGQSNPLVLLVPRGDNKKEQQLSEQLLSEEYVKSVISYVNSVGSQIPGEYVPSDILDALMSEEYSRFVITIDGNDEDGSSFEAVRKIRQIGSEYYGDEAYVAGKSASAYDLKEVVTKDNVRVNAIAISAIFLILIFNFKSISLPIILTLLIEASIWMNLTVPYFAGTKMNYIVYLIISAVQLGATIDYAILFTGNYLDNRQKMEKKETIIKTVDDTFLSLVTSAAIMIFSGVTLSVICTNGVIKQLGQLVGRGAFFSLFLVTFTLPILLMLCDNVIACTTKNVQFYGFHEKIDNAFGKISKKRRKR